MPIVTYAGQSSVAVAGQSTTYIVDKILTRMPAVPDSLVNSELQDTARHFYQYSTGWREVIGPYVVAANVADIYLNPIDSYKQVKYVLAAWMYPSPNGANTPAPLRLVTRKPIGPDVTAPTQLFMQTPDHGVLYPLPDKNYGAIMYAYAVLTPTMSSTQLPDFAITDHLDALMWGTMARLHFMKGKPWADRQLAEKYERDYKKEIRRVRDEANRAYSGADTPFRYPFFAPRHFPGVPVGAAG